MVGALKEDQHLVRKDLAKEYLVNALHDYKAGRRTGSRIAAMAEVAYPLSEDDMSALAHCVSRL